MTFSILAPFYPTLASEKYNLNFIKIGIIISVESFVAFITSFVMGKMMSFWGKRTLIIFGESVVIAGIFLFGIVKWICRF